MLDDKGKLSSLEDMETGRQYFSTCVDQDNEQIYVIGGYNHNQGVLNSIEKFVFKARKWSTERIPPINIA